MRYVPWKKLRKDENDNVLGFLPQAFQLRPDAEAASGWEDSLSVCWIEHFSEPTRKNEAVWELRRAQKAGGKSAFGIGNVGQIKAKCAAHGHRVRIVHEPLEGQPAHSGIRRLPPEDLLLLAALAEDAF